MLIAAKQGGLAFSQLQPFTSKSPSILGRGAHDLDSVPKLCYSPRIRQHASVPLPNQLRVAEFLLCCRAFSEPNEELKPLTSAGWLLFRNHKGLGRLERQDFDQNTMQKKMSDCLKTGFPAGVIPRESAQAGGCPEAPDAPRQQGGDGHGHGRIMGDVVHGDGPTFSCWLQEWKQPV